MPPAVGIVWFKVEKKPSSVFLFPLGVMSIAGPMVACVMWKLKQETIKMQRRTQAHMVDIVPLALATWSTWQNLGMVALMRFQTLYPKTNALVRMLQDETAQLIGACAMFQEAYINEPFPADVNPMPAYTEFMEEIERFPVLFERQKERISRTFDPQLARMLNAVIEMFNMLGHALNGDQWLLKVADAAAEASVRCRLYHGNGPSLLHTNPAHMPPGPHRDRAFTLSHPVVEDGSDNDSDWSLGEDEPTPEVP